MLRVVWQGRLGSLPLSLYILSHIGPVVFFPLTPLSVLEGTKRKHILADFGQAL